MDINIKLPIKARVLYNNARYIVLHGGRGSGKSWSVAIYLILLSMQKKVHILCAREQMNSIRESVHKLLADTISRYNLNNYFDIGISNITCKLTGSDFIFIGMNKIHNKKSIEGVDVLWIEEAENLTYDSINILFPSIRKEFVEKFDNIELLEEYLLKNPELNYSEYIDRENLTVIVPSKIIIVFNPNLESDPVYEKFIKNKPNSCIVQEMLYTDNPYFPATLQAEMQEDKDTDIELYNHKWLGIPNGSGSLIYSSFNKDVHVLDTTPALLREELSGCSCWVGMDPHSKYFPFVIYLAVIEEEGKIVRKVIYNEFPSVEYLGGKYSDLRKKKKLDINIEELCSLIRSYEWQEYGLKLQGRYLDTRFSRGAGGENVMTNTQGMIEILKKHKLVFIEPQVKMIDCQRLNIQNDLDYNKKLDITPFNCPDLYVAPWCKNTIEFFKFHREVSSGKGEEEKYKDGSDALRILYAGMSDYRPRKKKSSQGSYKKPKNWQEI